MELGGVTPAAEDRMTEIEGAQIAQVNQPNELIISR